MKRFAAYLAPVQLTEQIRKVLGNQVDDIQSQGLLRGDGVTAADGGHGPLGVAPAFLGNIFNIGGRVIFRLGPQDAVGVAFPSGPHRVSRTNPGVGRHGRDVRRQGDEGSRAGGGGAGGRDKNHHRHPRRIERLLDVVRGSQQSARGVQLEDEAFVMPGTRAIDCAGDVAGRGRTDGALDSDQSNLGGIHRHREENSDPRDEMPVLHKDPCRMQPTHNRPDRK